VKEARAETDSEACQICSDVGVASFELDAETATFCGVVNASDNRKTGITVNINSTIEVCGTVNIRNTSRDQKQKYGLIVQNGSVVNIHTSAELYVQNHAADGIKVMASNSKINLLERGRLSSINNGGFGLFIGKNDEDNSRLVCNSEQMRQLILLENKAGPVASCIEPEDIVDMNCWSNDIIEKC